MRTSQDILFQKRLDEICLTEACVIIPRQEGPWETASNPQGSRALRPDFAQVESGHFDKSRPACQCLRDSAHKIERCATQHEELGRVSRAIGKDSQEWKQPGLSLEFIDDHQSPEVLQNLFAISGLRAPDLPNQVCSARLRKYPGKGSFAAASTKEASRELG
jgi:hypothetical protein